MHTKKIVHIRPVQNEWNVLCTAHTAGHVYASATLPLLYLYTETGYIVCQDCLDSPKYPMLLLANLDNKKSSNPGAVRPPLMIGFPDIQSVGTTTGRISCTVTNLGNKPK